MSTLMKSRRLSSLGPCCAFVLFSTHLEADILELKDGSVLQGRIAGQDRTRIFLETKAGQRVVLKASLHRIRYDDPEAIERSEKSARERKGRELALLRRAEQARLARLARETLDRERLERERGQREKALRDRVAQERAAREGAERERAAAHKAGQANTGTTDRPSFALRAALVPGWGLWSAGEQRTGVLVGSTSAVLLAGAREEQFRAVRLRGAYTRSASGLFALPILAASDSRAAAFAAVLDQNRQNFARYKAHASGRERLLVAFTGLYLAQLGHAAVYLGVEPSPSSGRGPQHWTLAYRKPL